MSSALAEYLAEYLAESLSGDCGSATLEAVIAAHIMNKANAVRVRFELTSYPQE